MELNNVSLTRQQRDNPLLCQGMAENTIHLKTWSLIFNFTLQIARIRMQTLNNMRIRDAHDKCHRPVRTLFADPGEGGPQLVRGPEVLQRPVAQLPHQALPVRHLQQQFDEIPFLASSNICTYLALRVVSLEDGNNLREQGDEVGSLDVAVLLQLGDEAHERGGVGRVLRAQLLELGAEEGQGQLAGPELQCGRVAHQDFQLVQEMWRRHCSWQRSHLDISVSIGISISKKASKSEAVHCSIIIMKRKMRGKAPRA